MNWPGKGARLEWGTHCSRALVLRVGSSGRKFLYSSTSFSKDSNWLCSLLRRVGSDSRMWLVSCYRGKGRVIQGSTCLEVRKTQSTLSPDYPDKDRSENQNSEPAGRCQVTCGAVDGGTSVQAWDGPACSKTEQCMRSTCGGRHI